eukprot:CAMPEP_0201916288 /NCGR_PEP_ID=MMETSP0903-20130614/5957_1 /ASSEMBLY_ACC=CAM_ASM_000552 /TAXON_ID=420261 /ORGANISM="Thalassiosira antarctica, Strain CCMP982" /LENGTH=89 /DNA_ID=CAMNT_0048452059 /DNA_START=19 /DNA_END=286 /DNA_ORIENTATION=+
MMTTAAIDTLPPPDLIRFPSQPQETDAKAPTSLISPERGWPMYVYRRGRPTYISPKEAVSVGPPPATLSPNHCRHRQTHTSVDHDDAHS